MQLTASSPATCRPSGGAARYLRAQLSALDDALGTAGSFCGACDVTSHHVTATGQRLWPTRSLASGGAWLEVAQWRYQAGALSGRLWRRCSPPSNRTKPSVARAPVDCRALHRLGVSGRRRHAGASVPVTHLFSSRIRSPFSAPAMSARSETLEVVRPRSMGRFLSGGVYVGLWMLSRSAGLGPSWRQPGRRTVVGEFRASGPSLASGVGEWQSP